MKNFLLALAYLLLIATVLALSAYFYVRLDKIELKLDQILQNQATAVSQRGTAQPQNNNVVDLSAPSESEAAQPTGQPIGSVVNNQSGPTQGPSLRDHNTYLTIGASATNLVAATTPIFESASVPEVVKLKNGDLLLYFVDAAALTAPGTEQLGFSKSTDNGKTWSAKDHIIMTGKVNAGGAVDPSVVELSDGRLRMYFFGSETTQGDPMSMPGDHVVYSAISSDGLNWTVEAGERFAAERLSDPEVVQLSANQWVMYYSLGTTTGIATSTDGLTFTNSGKTWSGGGIPGAYIDANKVIHLYGCSSTGFNTASSTDGVTFSDKNESAFTTTVAGVCDPSPALLESGEVLMVYKQIDQ